MGAISFSLRGRRRTAKAFAIIPPELWYWFAYLAIRGWHGDEWRALVILSAASGAALGVVAMLSSPNAPGPKGLRAMLLFLTASHIGFALLQMKGWDPLFTPRQVPGLEPNLPAGFTGHHTMFGFLMACFAWFWLCSRGYVFFAACMLFLAASRSAFALASIFYALLWFTWCRGWKKCAALAGCAVAIAGANFFVDSAPGDFFFHNGRLPVWVYSVNAILEQPWLGCGIGEFSREFPAYNQVLRGMRWEEAHNELIEYVFNTGLVGLAALLPFLVKVGIRLWRKPMTPQKELAVGTLLMIGVNAMGSFPLQIAPFATLAIYAVAWALRPLPEDTPPPNFSQ